MYHFNIQNFTELSQPVHEKVSFKMAASCDLELGQKSNILPNIFPISIVGTPNLVKIIQTAEKLWRFNYFQLPLPP